MAGKSIGRTVLDRFLPEGLDGFFEMCEQEEIPLIHMPKVLAEQEMTDGQPFGITLHIRTTRDWYREFCERRALRQKEDQRNVRLTVD